MPDALRIIFAGTPQFAVPSLQALLDSEHHVLAVYTQPDRQAGRGRKLTASKIKQLAQAHHIPVYQPASLSGAAEQAQLNDLKADLMIVAAYGLLLPAAVLKMPRLGCINVHASLLPRWRGASPIQYAILAGDEKTGITIMQMDAGLDTGDILHHASCTIQADDTASTLHDRLAILGVQTLLAVLAKLPTAQARAQDASQASYAPKITKQEAMIDWQKSARQLDRQIRAFNPWPIAYTQSNETVVRIFQACPLKETTTEAPGTIIRVSKQGIDVATGDHLLRLQQLQLPGGKCLHVSDLLNARYAQFMPGMCLWEKSTS